MQSLSESGRVLPVNKEDTLAWCHREEFKDRAIAKALDSMKETQSSRALFYFIFKGWYQERAPTETGI